MSEPIGQHIDTPEEQYVRASERLTRRITDLESEVARWFKECERKEFRIKDLMWKVDEQGFRAEVAEAALAVERAKKKLRRARREQAKHLEERP